MSADALRAQLVGAAVRQHRRRQRRRRLAAAVAAVAGTLGVGTLVVGPPPPLAPRAADAEVRVEERGDRLVVTLVDLEHDPRAIQAALRRAGVRARVTAIPVGPPLVGRFVGDALEGQLPSSLQPFEAGVGCSFPGFSLPAGWPGELHLQVGRPARGEEPYGAFVDATSPGEPLAGVPLVGGTVADAARRLVGTALAVDVEAVDHGPSAVLPLPAAATGDHGRWVVVTAEATAAHRVVLRAQRPERPPPARRGC